MKPIDSHEDFSAERIAEIWPEIEKIAAEELGMVTGRELYVNQFEIVSSEQLLDCYASIGLPVHYHHWSFGKSFVENERKYKRGHMGLALEMVINSNPCINYLSEQNSMIEQTMVMAHAGVGHNFCFANNVYFTDWTQASNIVDYMVFARDFIARCEQQYGEAEVEEVLDACHALERHGIDKYKRKHRGKQSETARLKRILEEDDRRQREMDIVMRKTSLEWLERDDGIFKEDEGDGIEEEENLLYFIMKRAPSFEKLPRWKREIMRISYKVNTYFQNQGLTKVLNEGIATFCHYYIMTRLEEKGIITPDAFIAFLDCHASVVYQPSWHSRHYSGPNPYALGFNILMDLKRMCEAPTDEDREWFPQIVGRDWREVIKEAVINHRDDSFIQQYLSPKVIRDMRLFNVNIEYGEDSDFKNATAIATVSEIHDEVGYSAIRTLLARSKERINYVPQIVVESVDFEGDRVLNLRYDSYRNRQLDEDDAALVMEHVYKLWGYGVKLKD